MSKLYTCSRCGKKKQAFEFAKNSSAKTRNGIDYLCKLCHKENAKIYREQNKDKVLQYQKNYKEENKEKIASYMRDYNKQYRVDNKDKLDKYLKDNREKRLAQKKIYRDNNRDKLAEYRRNNKGKRNADWAKYRASKLQACPNWLSTTDLSRIKSIYKMANNLTKKTGNKHHVDHIIPLQGKTVCGLHVPWNLQILPESINCSKSNKLIDEDMV